MAFSLIPQPSLLKDPAAGFDHADVPLDFMFKSFLQKPERIQVLDFDLGAKFRSAAQPHAHIRIAAQRTFFHVAVTHPAVEQNLAQRCQIRVRFFRCAHVWLADDFA